jgi:hypothetical protein
MILACFLSWTSVFDAFKFRNWVNRLREDPEKGGIPAKNVDDVKKVLDTFFPIRYCSH